MGSGFIVQIGIPIDVKDKYFLLRDRINKEVPFSVFFGSLLDFELELLNSNGENNEFRKEFNNTFFVLYTKKYAYNLEKQVIQSIIHVDDFVFEKYLKLVNSYVEKLNVKRGVSYTVLDTLISVVGFEIDKDTRFIRIFEENFKRHFKFN